MKPGPAPSCLCGHCRTCRCRRYRAANYRKNPEQLSREKAEYKRRRLERLKEGPSDEELDRRAAEWLRSEVIA